MRVPDTFTESLFTLRKLEDFVPGKPLRPIRQMVNAALVKKDALFSGMYEDDQCWAPRHRARETLAPNAKNSSADGVRGREMRGNGAARVGFYADVQERHFSCMKRTNLIFPRRNFDGYSQ